MCHLGSRLFLARYRSGRGISVQRFIGTDDARAICAQNAYEQKTGAIVMKQSQHHPQSLHKLRRCTLIPSTTARDGTLRAEFKQCSTASSLGGSTETRNNDKV